MTAVAKCPHPDMEYHVHTANLGDSIMKAVEIKAKCRHCGKDMRFIGLPTGVSFQRPTVSADGLVVRFPMLAQDEEPDTHVEALLRVGP